MGKFKIGDEALCLDDAPGVVSKMKTIQKMKKYKVLATWNEVFIMVNDGTNGWWHERRFTKPTISYGEKVASDIMTKIKIEELLTKKLSAQ